jgi:hypothetical protein
VSHFLFIMLTVATSMLVLVSGLVKVSEYRGRVVVGPPAPELGAQPASRTQRQRAFLVMFAPAAFVAYTWAPGALGVPFETHERG